MKTEIKKAISSELRKLRAGTGLKIEEIATKSGVNKDTISRYENGKNYMRIDILYKLISAYDVTIDYFFTQVNANMHKQ